MTAENKKLLIVALVGLLAGLAIGIFYAWMINPVVVVDTTPANMRPDLQEDYMRMILDSYRVTGDSNLAVTRYYLLGAGGPTALAAVAPTYDPAVVASFNTALLNSSQQQPTPAPETGGATTGGGSMLGTILIVFGVVAILAVLGFALYYLFRQRGSAAGGEKTAAAQAIETNKSFQKTDFVSQGAAPPVAQFVTTYVIGDDLFDDSFSIDSPAGEFLGECGVGISETIGVGDPKKVTAFEVWVFDKNDIQTVTKVMMSPHAFRDGTFQAKLESKGELVELTPGKQVSLETATLQLVASIADVQYGQGPLPPESYFDRMTLEIAIWQKAQ